MATDIQDAPQPALPKNFRSSLHRYFYRQFSAWRQDLWFVTLALVLAAVLILPTLVQTIPAGQVGVVYKRFGGGTDVTSVLTEGVVLVLPWDVVTLYGTRVQIAEEILTAMTADGLKVDIQASWRYHLVPGAAGLVHKAFGPGYSKAIVDNTVSHVLRDVVANFATEDLYSSARGALAATVYKGAQQSLTDLESIAMVHAEALAKQRARPIAAARGKKLPDIEWVQIEDVLIKEIDIPKGLEEAIVRKNEARTLVEEFDFKIQAEQKEVERKRIEALGIRNFQDIVSSGLSDSYLAWKGISATLELAKSPNAKVVMFGSGRNGLPVILNTDGASPVTTPAPKQPTDAAKAAAPAAAVPAAPR